VAGGILDLIDAREIETELALLQDPNASFLSPMLWCVRARRPTT
jgi:hypothetical protein